MCVIVVAKKRRLTDAEINKMWDGNDDGAGMAWREGSIQKGTAMVCYKKGMMTKEEFLTFYHSKKFSLPHVVHFRITSSGTTVPELTHPFTVAPDSPLALEHKGIEPVLFHNGTWSEWSSIISTTAMATGTNIPGAINDSRTIAIVGHWIPKMLDEIVKKSASRLAILYSDKVAMLGHFEDTEDGGLACSNMFWKEDRKTVTYYQGQLVQGEYGYYRPTRFSTPMSAFGIGPTSSGVWDDDEVERMIKKQGEQRKLSKKERKAFRRAVKKAKMFPTGRLLLSDNVKVVNGD